MSLFDFLKRKPQSYAGPALLATEPTITPPTGPALAPSFAESRRVPQKLTLPEAGIQSSQMSSQGSSLFSPKPVAPLAPAKRDPFKDNFGEVQGLIDDQTLASGSVPRIVEAVKAAQRTIAAEKYNPIDEKSSWLQRLWEPTKQAIQTPGETLITQAQNIANYGLEPMGYTSRPITRKGQLEALDRVLEKYAPEELVNSKLIRAMEGEQSAPMGAAEFTTNIGTAVVGSTAAINAFRSLPIAARLKSAGEGGIYATHFMENLIASAVASTPGSIGKKKPGDFHKLMITNGGFLFPTASYGGLAIATTASFLGNMAMGQNGWEAAGNSVLGLAGAAVQRKDLLSDLYTYRKGAFTDALRTLVRARMGDDIPAPIREAAIDEAAQLRAYYEQNPQDLDGLYKMTLDSSKRMIKLYGEYQKASPTGEQRLIGMKGPTQDGPDGGFPEPAKIGNNKVAPVDMNKANDPGIQRHIELEQKLRPGSVKQALIPIDKIDVQIDESGGLHHITAKPGDQFPPPVATYDPDTGRFTMKDGDHRIAFFKDSGYNKVPMLVIDKGGSLPGDFNLPLPSSVPATPESSLPSVFAKQPTAGPSTIPIAPRIAPSPVDGPTWAENLADQGADPNVAPTVIPQGKKPIPLPEARQAAVDLYRELDSEYNPEFQSKADLGEEYVSAEQNAGLAQELITNPKTRGVVQSVTGKQGYAALEGLEISDMGPFVTKLRNSVENGTPAAEALDNIRIRIKDGADGDYGREVLDLAIGKSRGEVRKQPKRPTEEEILAVIDKAIADGRLQMTDETNNGKTVEQVYERIYAEMARKSDATKEPSIRNEKTPAGANKPMRLGDILQKEDSKQLSKQRLSPQQISDAQAEANLSNRDMAAIYKADEQFETDLEKSRKLTQIEYNNTVAEAKQLPPEVSKKIIADLEALKAAGKIATPLEAKLQKNKFLGKLLTQQKSMTRTAQRAAVAAKKDANNERMKSLFKTVPRMPNRIQGMMRKLHEGYRKSMPLAQQEQIVQQMKDLSEIGSQQNRLFNEKREAADSALAQEVIETAVKKVKPQDKRVRDRVGALLMNETPPNLVILNMGEGAMNVFKRSMDEGMNEAWPKQRDWDREVLAKAQEIGIKHDDMQNIVDYSLWNRGGKAGELARSRLSRMGVTEPTLTDKQKQFYEWQQKFLKILAGETKAVYERENPLRELDISDPNYFPMKVIGNDMTVSKGPNTMSLDQVPDGFTKNIKGNEELDIYREPDALFRHINDVAHYVTLTERMQQMRRILERKEVTAALGNENVDYLQNRWLDMVARHGQYAEKVNEAMAMLNSMGNRAYGGVLAMKAIVGIRQFGSVIDAFGPLLKMFGVGPTATYLGKVLKNTPAVLSEHLTVLGDYIETNPDLQASVGLTDLVMEQVKGGEFSSRHTFLERHPKLNKFVFAFIRQPDLLGRATLAMHVEGLYKARGMEQPEAQRLAMELVNNVFGSMRVHNRPTASGHANTKPLYLFGQTQRARQGMYRQAMKDWAKDPLGNSAILGSYTLSSMILMYLASLTIEDDDNREKAQKQSIYWGWFYGAVENTLPVVGSMISRTLQTGDASNAIPYLGMVLNALGSYRQVITGVKPETKIKGALRGTEQTLGAMGIPAPAIRSNYNLINNLYKDFVKGNTFPLPENSSGGDGAFKETKGFKSGGEFKATGGFKKTPGFK